MSIARAPRGMHQDHGDQPHGWDESRPDANTHTKTLMSGQAHSRRYVWPHPAQLGP